MRPGEPGDLPSVVELYNHYVLCSPATFEVTPVRVEDRREWFVEHSNPGPYRLLVAERLSGEVVGWATTSAFRPRAAYATTVEASVYCRADAVGRGIGTRLYAELFRENKGQDIEQVVAGIALPNPASVALHRRFGFRHVGTFRRVGRKFGRLWDVAWFERPLRLPGKDPGTGRPVRRHDGTPGGLSALGATSGDGP